MIAVLSGGFMGMLTEKCGLTRPNATPFTRWIEAKVPRLWVFHPLCRVRVRGV